MSTHSLSIAYFGKPLENTGLILKNLYNKKIEEYTKLMGFSINILKIRKKESVFSIYIKELNELVSLNLERAEKSKDLRKAVKFFYENFDSLNYSPKNLCNLTEKKIFEMNLRGVYALLINNDNKYSDYLVNEVIDSFKNVNKNMIISVKDEKWPGMVVNSLEDALEYILNDVSKSKEKELKQQ